MLKSYWKTNKKEMGVMLVFQINNYYIYIYFMLLLFRFTKTFIYTTLTSQRTGHNILQDAKYLVAYIKGLSKFLTNFVL